MRRPNARQDAPAGAAAPRADCGPRAANQTTHASQDPRREALGAAVERLLVGLRHVCDRCDLDYGSLDRRAVDAYHRELAHAPPVSADNPDPDRRATPGSEPT